MRVIQNERGVLHVPMALLSLILVITGLGLWGLVHHWKTLAATQLRIDRCTGETALDLKYKLSSIVSANQHIQELRIAEAAALLLQPDVAEALQVAAYAEFTRQEAIRTEWSVKELKWTAQNGCGKGDISSLLPPITWKRGPSDELGPQPIDVADLKHSYRFEIVHRPRASAAEVIPEGEKNGILKTPKWRARWVQPLGIIGTSIR